MSTKVLKIITSIVLAFVTILNFITGGKPVTETEAKVNGSLVCTDALGRGVTSAGAESDKLVGVFYFLWLGQHGRDRIIDNTEIVKNNPDAVKSEFDWVAAGGGNGGETHFWGKPLFDYYTTDDTWVMRKHVQMLTDANVDFIVIDITNAFTYSTQAKMLIDILYEYYIDGWDVPKIAFYTNSASGDTMNRIYDELYNDSEFRAKYPLIDDMWFYMDGKPMIVGIEDDPALRKDVKKYFRIKDSQWPFDDKKNDGFPWMEFHRSLTVDSVYNAWGKKIMNVSAAQHSDTCEFSRTAWYGANDRTRSWHDGANDTSEGAMLYGYNFAEQWEFAIKMDPDIIFVTGFNEWGAQRQSGTPQSPVRFIDCATENTSRDVEPSAGVLGDNYYLQMVDYIAKFKNTTSRVAKNNEVSIDIDGGFDQWRKKNITAVYEDYENDIVDRNCEGFGKVMLTDTSGRNDIVNMKVTEDVDNYYFYVDTANELTSSEDNNWMTLFINEKYAVNRTSPINGKTSVEKITEAGYEKISEAEIRFENNKLMIKLAKSDIEESENLTFKWADNYNENDIYSFYTQGDCAPYGRLCYVY